MSLLYERQHLAITKTDLFEHKSISKRLNRHRIQRHIKPIGHARNIIERKHHATPQTSGYLPSRETCIQRLESEQSGRTAQRTLMT